MEFDLTETVTFDKMEEMVQSFLPKNRKKLMSFAIFKDAGQTEEDEWQVKIPNILSDEPLLKGTYNFLIDYWRVCSLAKMSPPVKNPTWKDVIVQFNELLQDGGCNVFLEGLRVNNDNVITFSVGS